MASRPFRTIKPAAGTPSVSRGRLTQAVRSMASVTRGRLTKAAQSMVLTPHDVVSASTADSVTLSPGSKDAASDRSANGRANVLHEPSVIKRGPTSKAASPKRKSSPKK